MDLEKIPYQFIYVDLMVKNLQRDLQIIQKGPFKIKEPYIRFIETLISKAIKERRKLKQIMHDHNIHIKNKGVQNDLVIYRFYINRKEKEVHFNKYVLKKNVKEMMTDLIENK